MPRPDGQGSGNELADRRTKRNVTVVDIERRLGLIHAAASSQRENVNHQDRDYQPSQTGSQEKASRRRYELRS